MILNIKNKLNITLCGMMGSGKSTIGKLLAKKLDFQFIDIDRKIEKKTNKSISSIFEQYGEEYFRSLEEKVTIITLKKERVIISLGGGAIINKNINNYIKKYSYNIYLSVNIDILKKRLINSAHRPLIRETNINLVLRNLIKEREKFYQRADLKIINETNIKSTLGVILQNITND